MKYLILSFKYKITFFLQFIFIISLLPYTIFSATNEIRWAYEDVIDEAPAYWQFAEAYDNWSLTSTVRKIFDPVEGADFLPVTNEGYLSSTSLLFSFDHDGTSDGAIVYLPTRTTSPDKGEPPVDWTDAYDYKDISLCSNLNFWIKPDGNPSSDIDVTLDLYADGGPLGSTIELKNYGVSWASNKWQQVIIPVSNFNFVSDIQKQRVSHIIFQVKCTYVGSFSFLVDNVRFKTFLIPDTPSGLYSESLGEDKIKIAWKDVDEEEGYYVYTNSVNNISTARIAATLTKDTTNFIETNLSPGSFRVYWVSAFNFRGESSLSTSTSNITQSSLPPAPPSGLSILVVSPVQLIIMWNSVPGASGYRVYRSLYTNLSFSTQIVSKNITKFTDSNLSPSTTYYYWITATNLSGNESDFSVRVSATTPEKINPPLFKKALGISTNSVALSWTSIPYATSYTLFRGYYNDFNSYDYRISLSSTVTNFTNSSLKPNSLYYYWIKVSIGSVSSSLSLKTQARTLSSEFRWCFETSSNFWNHPELSNPFETSGTGEKIEYITRTVRISNQFYDITIPRDFLPVDHNVAYNGSSSLKIGIIKHIQDDNYWIKAFVGTSTNGLGGPPLSEKDEKTRKNLSKYGFLKFYIKGDGSGKFCRIALQDAKTYDITKDNVNIINYVDDIYSRNWQEVLIPFSRFTFDSTVRQTNIKSIVFIVDNSFSEGSWSFWIDNISFTMKESVPVPSRPVFSDIRAINTNEIRLSWQPSKNAVSYTLYRSTNSLTSDAIKVAGLLAGKMTYNDSGLDTGKVYYYWLKASSPEGSSLWSEPVFASTLPSGSPPAQPYGLKAKVYKDIHVELHWESLPLVESFEIYRNIESNFSSAEKVATVSHDVLYLLDRFLEQNTTYYYWVVAVNVNGSSPPSTPVMVRTKENIKTGEIKVLPNYITPQTESVRIIFNNPVEGKIDLYLYDMAGRLVWSYSGTFNKGAQTLEWDINDNEKRSIGSGLYALYIKGKGWKNFTKLILQR